MNYTIEDIIEIMDRFAIKSSTLDEQDFGADSAPKNNVKVWASGITRGKANPLMVKGEKWSSGASRGKANPLMVKGEKWSSGASRGLANPIANDKWSDLYGIKRGVANSL